MKVHESAWIRSWCRFACASSRWPVGQALTPHVDLCCTVIKGISRLETPSPPVNAVPLIQALRLGMARDESSGLTVERSVTPSQDWPRFRILTRPLASFPPNSSSEPSGRTVSGSWFRGARYLSSRTGYTCLPKLYYASRAHLVWASSAANTPTSYYASAESPCPSSFSVVCLL